MPSYLYFRNHSDRKKHYIHLLGKKPVAEVKDKLFKACFPSSGIPTEESKQFGAYEWVMPVVEITSARTPQVGFTKTELQHERLLMSCFSHRPNKVARMQIENVNQNLRCSFLCSYTKPPGQQRQKASTEMPTAGCKIYVKNVFQFLCEAAVYRQGETYMATLLPPVLFGDITWQERRQY